MDACLVKALKCFFSLPVYVQSLWLESGREKVAIPAQLTLSLSFSLSFFVFLIPRTSRRLSIGVFSPFILCDLVAPGSPSLPLLATLPSPLLPWEYHDPTPYLVPFFQV